ncbi:MAG: hypothetical protein Q9213_005650 [Squamulea squamosa]
MAFRSSRTQQKTAAPTSQGTPLPIPAGLLEKHPSLQELKTIDALVDIHPNMAGSVGLTIRKYSIDFTNTRCPLQDLLERRLELFSRIASNPASENKYAAILMKASMEDLDSKIATCWDDLRVMWLKTLIKVLDGRLTAELSFYLLEFI